MINKKLVLSVLGLTTLFGCFVYAETSNTLDFKRNFQLDVVDIGLSQSQDTYEKVLPYQKVEYKLYVENTEQSAWVRVKVPENEFYVLDDIYEGWVEHNGYYYYTEPMNCQCVLLCSSIQFVDFDQSYQGTSHEVTVEAEAIQAAHFTLDLDKEDPFDGQKILKANVRGGMNDE